MPQVSICIPTYNTARYLGHAIDSVLTQEFSDFELVICDNASTDGTPDLVRRYKDQRIRYLRFDDLTNQAGNFNRCLAEVRGELLTILHSDDAFLPGFLADRTSRFARDADLGMVFGAVEIIDANGVHTSTAKHWENDQTFEQGELVDELVMACLVSPPSLMVRRELARAAGMFRTDLTWGHDWEWTIRVAERGKAQYASEPLAAYRVHDASGTAEVLNAARNGYQEQRILREVFARLSSRPSLQARKGDAYRALSLRQMYYAEQSLFADRKEVSRNNLWYALRADAGMILRPTLWALFISTFGPTSFYRRYLSLRKIVV